MGNGLWLMADGDSHFFSVGRSSVSDKSPISKVWVFGLFAYGIGHVGKFNAFLGINVLHTN